MPGNARWSERERDVMREFYPMIPLKKLSEALPGRSAAAIRDFAHRHGIRKDSEVVRTTISEGRKHGSERKPSEGGCDTVESG